MPSYVVFFISANRRSEAEQSEVDEEIKKDPRYKKTLKAFLDWIHAEIKAKRITDGRSLLESSEETNIRIEFHPTREEDSEEDKDATTSQPPDPSITRGQQADTSANILCYYTAEFPTLDDAISWGKSCPVSYDGFALEIRQLQDAMESVSEAPEKEKEWIGDQILSARKKMLEEGKMKVDEDGTRWLKLEDPKEIGELVSEAEKRDAQKEDE